MSAITTFPAGNRVNGNAREDDDRAITVRPQSIGGLAEQQRVTAEIQSRLMAAKSCPRDEVAAVEKIMTACQRPGLAENAEYVYSRGGTDISGASIDLMTVIANSWGNIDYGFRELSQANGESHLEAYAWDLESNAKRTIAFTVPHKRFSKNYGLSPLIDPRDVYENNANNAARRMRKCLEDIIPSDVVEDALKECSATLKAKADVTPDAIAKVLEFFAKFEITRDQIQKRLGRRLEAMQPAQLVKLRAIGKSLQDGMSEPGDWFEAATPDVPEPPRTATEAAKAALKANRAAVPQQAAATPMQAPPEADHSQEHNPIEATAQKQEIKQAAATATRKAAGASEAKADKSTSRAADVAPKQSYVTVDGLKAYMQMTFEADCGDFDLDELAAVAIEQGGDHREFFKSVFSRKHPRFGRFLVATLRAGDDDVGDEVQGTEDVNQETDQAEASQEDTSPDFLHEPLPRPKALDLIPASFEKKIIGKRSPEEIRRFAAEEVKGNPDLASEEAAYLLDLAQRRAYQLEHAIPTTDKLPK